MNWLVNYTITSMVMAFLVLKGFDYLVGRPVANLLRAVVFVCVRTCLTTSLSMRAFTHQVRHLRRASKEVLRRLDSPTPSK